MNIEKIGIVGAGQMGRGIAQVAAFTGFEVILYDVNKDGLDFGHDFIKKQLARGIEKGKWDDAKVSQTLANLTASTIITDLKDCDLIIEAATENKAIKFQIFKEHVIRSTDKLM